MASDARALSRRDNEGVDVDILCEMKFAEGTLLLQICAVIWKTFNEKQSVHTRKGGIPPPDNKFKRNIDNRFPVLNIREKIPLIESH